MSTSIPIEQPNMEKLSPENAPQPRPVTPLMVQPAKSKNEPSLNTAAQPQNRPVTPPLIPSPQPIQASSLAGELPPPLDTVNGKGSNLGQSDPTDLAKLTDAPKLSPQPEDVDIVFINDLPSTLKCKICEQVLRAPQKLPCGHLFCLTCLKGLKTCPICNQNFDESMLKLDKQVERQIQELAVKCSYFDNGCTWTGILRELKTHAMSCEYADTICPRGCGEVYPINLEKKHLEECTRKVTPCDHCNKEVSLRYMKGHLKLCPSMLIDCPNRCGIAPKTRAEIQDHLPNCPKKGAVCPFAEFGCKYSSGRENIQKHIKEELVQHLSLVGFGLVEFNELVAHVYMNLEKIALNNNLLQTRIDSLDKLYGAQYIWRIENYSQRFEEARSKARPQIFSPPFMSGRHGYKLILSAGLFGDGRFRGQFMSVYICILKGEYDEILSWPFVHQINLSLMDQNPDVNARRHLVYAVKPRPTKENIPYLAKPKLERNAGFGAEKFCPLNQVQPFVRENVLFIRCQIDTEAMLVL